MTFVPIRDAATLIVLRDFPTAPKVLMGQRGAKAAFMPNKFVFPGGAVDAADADVDLASPISSLCQDRLLEDGDGIAPATLAVAAIRELWEETGLRLCNKDIWADPPHDWVGFAKSGARPCAKNLHYFFRAITPPGRPRRFDARFFIVDAAYIDGDLDDFGAASDELSHLHWVPLAEVRQLDLPFITSVVLGEVAAITKIGPPSSIPFFKNTDEASLFERLGQSQA